MTAIISKYGELLYIIEGNEETIALNTPDSCEAVDNPPCEGMKYFKGEWIELPIKPSDHHVFDYLISKWVDKRSIDDIREQHWIIIKGERDSYEYGGLIFDGYHFDSDTASQTRIITACALGCNVQWTLSDNSVIELSSESMNQLRSALAIHLDECHTRGRIARQAIYAAETIEEINLVRF